jgi:hypothetical protein
VRFGVQLALSICLGLGLSAACGFRVFVPLLGLSMAALSGHVELADGFAWIGTWPAFGCLLTATIVEIAAFYVPWIDNLLDSMATPAAIVAGTMATASVVTDMSPLMKWSLALIAGGGVAGTVQIGTVLARAASTFSTAGVTNFVVSTGELISSIVMTVVAIVLPLVVAALVAAVLAWVAFRYARRGQVARCAPADGVTSAPGE